MKKFVFLFLFFGCQLSFGQNIEKKPLPPRAVNDFGNMLEPFQRDALEKKIDDYNDSTSSAIVIITVTDLGGYDIADVSLKYLRDWGVGTKEKNNGIVVLVSKNDHSARIETGYGMEGVIPDVTAKEIIDDKMIPAFKSNDYYRGFDNAVDAIIQAAAGEYKASPKSGAKSGGFPTIFILVILFV
ncbi:MAG: TPM domain-containing protein, partial [Ginsengibacter sp.]